MQVDVGGVLPLLLMASGFAAMARGSELIEPKDLVRAIYIADLEHVSMFWRDWEGFEKLVTAERLANGVTETYINRPLYLIQLHSMMSQKEGFYALGNPSEKFKEIVAAARELASRRTGLPSTPTSRDLLFCTCSQDSELSTALQNSGLQLEKLALAVEERS